MYLSKLVLSLQNEVHFILKLMHSLAREDKTQNVLSCKICDGHMTVTYAFLPLDGRVYDIQGINNF